MERIKTKRKKNFKNVLKRNILGWLFMLLPLALFAFFVWVPMGKNVVLSFFNDYSYSEFVGFKNYEAIMNDQAFLTALFNTFKYILWSLVIGFIVPIFLGFLLSEVVHAKGIFRVLLYLPAMISGIAVVFLFKNIYGDESYSILNIITTAFGGKAHAWKSNPDIIIPLIVLAMTWKGAGSTALIYLNSFQNIDRSIYEASRIDGASPWQRFWKLTIPVMKATLILLMILQIISVFQVFYEPLVIGNWGGPEGNASMSLMLLSYTFAFGKINGESLQFAKSAATSVILALIIIAVTIIFNVVQRLIEKKGRR